MLIGDVTMRRNQADEIAALTGTHIKTVYKWFRLGKFPRPVELLLRLVYGGELGLISAEWDGFWIQRRYGCLVTDQGYTYQAGDIRAWQIHCHERSMLKRRVKELEAQLDALLVDQPSLNDTDAALQLIEPVL